MEKLPIWGTVKESFQFCFSDIKTLTKLALIPMGLYLALILIQFYGFDLTTFNPLPELAPDYVQEESLLSVMFSLVPILIILPLITAWHRRYLEKDDSQRLQFGKREVRYLGYLILLVFLLVILGVSTAVIAVFAGKMSSSATGGAFIIIALGVVLGIIIYSRFSMVFPAASIGARAGLKDSWRATRGFVLRITGINLLLFLILALVLGTVGGLIFAVVSPAVITGNMSDTTLGNIILLIGLIHVPVQMFTTAVGVSTLSIIYRFLSTRDDMEVSAD